MALVDPVPPGTHQDPLAGSGAESGLVQSPTDHLDVVGGGTRARFCQAAARAPRIHPYHRDRGLLHTVSGRSPKPLLKVGAAPSLSERTSTRVASISVTSGRSAEIPAVGASASARAHTRCRTVLRARLTATSTASTLSARVLDKP